MFITSLLYESYSKEWCFVTSRSSGNGGQNVNKVESKVTLRFDIPNSSILNENEKQVLLRRARTYINNDGILSISSSTSRSQLQNKKIVIKRFFEIIANSFKETKIRIKTKTPKSVKENILKNKKYNSVKKNLRKKVDEKD